MARASGRVIPPLAAAKAARNPGEVPAQVGAEFVVRCDAHPQCVLLGAGQHRVGLGKLGIREQGTVGMCVGAQDVGQHPGVNGSDFRPTTEYRSR